MPTISIIIPVYKVEKYIRECLNSILNQTYTDWEALLIDDGSPDNSGAICDEYAVKDSRFRVFHKPNGGVSSARNMGITKAQGDYISFVDSDDMLLPNALEICMRAVMENRLDLLQFGFTRSWDVLPDSPKQCGTILDSHEFLKTKHNVCVWGGCIRRDILVTNKILFVEGMKFAEDQLFVLHSIRNSKRLMRLEDKLYYYRDNSESATHNGHPEDYYASCEILVAEKRRYPEFAKVIDNAVLTLVLSLITVSSDRQLLSNTIKLYKEAEIRNCDHVCNSGRLFYWFAKVDFRLARFLYCFYIQIKGVS